MTKRHIKSLHIFLQIAAIGATAYTVATVPVEGIETEVVINVGCGRSN